MAKRQGKQSACRDCTYIRYCGGFRDQMARCPEWVTNKRLDTTAHDASSNAPLAGGGNEMSSDCGCIIGEYHCPEAERLWRLVNEAYYATTRSAGDTYQIGMCWAEYERRHQVYGRHMAIANDPAYLLRSEKEEVPGETTR